MPTRPVSEIVEELIGDALFKEATQILMDHFKKGSNNRDEAILLRARYSRYKIKHNGNTASQDELEQELNRIGIAILDLSAKTPVKKETEEDAVVVSLTDLENEYQLAIIRVKVREILLSGYGQGTGLTTGEVTQKIELPRQFVSRELRKLEALGLLRKVRSQGRTSFTLNENGFAFLQGLNT